MKKPAVVFLFVLFSGLVLPRPLSGQEQDPFLVVFYNLENLFDLTNDPAIADDDFTPSGAMEWTRERYSKKLHDLAMVLSAVDSTTLPAVAGLCEVENRQVLEDLVGQPALAPGKFGIVHYDSPDARGIDVALIYRPDRFMVFESRPVPVIFPFDTITTRDILYVKGLADNTDTLHVFVNHWSSRREGQRQTERRRIYAGVVLRKAVDSVMNYNPAAKILIMGDFNDEPTNQSLHSVLNANNKRINASSRELYNLMYDMHNMDGKGSLNYRGTWNMLDQIIVSRSMLEGGRGLRTDFSGGKIFRDKRLMYDHPEWGYPVPNRTYGGTNYFGGISDHLPVFVILSLYD